VDAEAQEVQKIPLIRRIFRMLPEKGARVPRFGMRGLAWVAVFLLFTGVPLAMASDKAGLAARYPGDAGIARDPAVVFCEDFESPDVEALGRRWGDVSNKEGAALGLSKERPAASRGAQSLQITATRGENTGGHLFKVLKPGYDELYIRFYVKFAADHGFLNHFVKLQGSIDPPSWPEGEAGHKPADGFSTGLEPQSDSCLVYPFRSFPPPGIWHFYTYWPEMRSWQNLDGTGSSYYGNDFEPQEPALVSRDRWQCVEFMVKMNSEPQAHDGEQAFWIDGKLAGRFAPGSVTGSWVRDIYRLDGQKGAPFEGLRWRTDPRVAINKVWLLYYVNPAEGTAEKNEAYHAGHPEMPLNTQTSTAWFDDLVVARSYIGPIAGG
jgi:hypothetical protein